MMDPKPFLFMLLCVCVNSESDCNTTAGKGQCVELDECEIFKSKLTGPKRDKNVYDLLKKYNCGYIGNIPKVCCPVPGVDIFTELINPKDCYTPNGDIGTCTKLEDCSYMSDKLRNKEFVLAENMEFIKRSKCTPPGSSTKLSYVCCKSELGSRIDATSSSPLQIPDNPSGKKCSLSAIPPKPDSDCCGIESTSDPRIIGGKETAIDQFPWLVVIEYTRIGYSCGGSLISGRYVLTAAHCLVGSKGKSRTATNVRLGEYNTTEPGPDCVAAAGGGDDCTDGAISIPIENYVVHEGYDADQVLQYHDIGLIRLTEVAPYTDFIRPICLPTSDFTISTPDNLNFFIAGWGIFDERQQLASEVKLYAKVPYVRKEQCSERYKKLGRQSLADSQLCVGGEANRDSCKGDSGGPLMLLKNLTYEVAGVVSFGTKSCGLQNWPSIYTKVYDYLDWINANIKP